MSSVIFNYGTQLALLTDFINYHLCSIYKYCLETCSYIY